MMICYVRSFYASGLALYRSITFDSFVSFASLLSFHLKCAYDSNSLVSQEKRVKKKTSNQKM